MLISPRLVEEDVPIAEMVVWRTGRGAERAAPRLASLGRLAQSSRPLCGGEEREKEKQIKARSR